jgi:hypothetical protein
MHFPHLLRSDGKFRKQAGHLFHTELRRRAGLQLRLIQQLGFQNFVAPGQGAKGGGCAPKTILASHNHNIRPPVAGSWMQSTEELSVSTKMKPLFAKKGLPDAQKSYFI